MKMRACAAAIILLGAGHAAADAARAADPAPASIMADSEAAEAKQADEYFQNNNLVAALPLYEHLAQILPQNPVVAERLAFCLMSKMDNLAPGAEQNAVFARTKAATDQARKLGDHSAFLQVVIDRLSKGPNVTAGRNPIMSAAEAAFSRGDLDAALAGYQALAAEDPKSYEARLFAGDIYFRKHDLASAGEWFQKAIDVNPNVETAYRYWGDALVNADKIDAALQKFIDAVVADPYMARSWMGLRQWADRAAATVKAPSVPVPKAPEPQKDAAGKTTTTIEIGPDALKNPQAGAAWLTYSAMRASWREQQFSKNFPNEKTYRHSLAEETLALKTVVLTVQSQNIPEEKLDPGLKDLMRLDKDGMIEPYVLLNAADQGIAQDYAAYRADHRDQLHAYIERYVVHRGAK
jgi:tetratricopeptide (TPR) repeat protein